FLVSHLGDPKPAIKPGHYTLFGFRFCPFVDRVRMVLEYYKIPYDVVWISLSSKPSWYLEMNPIGKVPLLINKEGKTIVESDVIMRYLDETSGNKRLMSLCGETEWKRAGMLASKLAAPSFGILYGVSVRQEDASAYREACQEVDDAIKGPYFLGSELTLADFLLFAHLNHFEAVMARLDGVAPAEVCDVSMTDPNLVKWLRLVGFLNAMRRLPCVDSAFTPPRIRALYAESYRKGQPNPDL
ncbi:Glutathione S-transferase omega class, partial [Fasciolopsis buskii]